MRVYHVIEYSISFEKVSCMFGANRDKTSTQNYPVCNMFHYTGEQHKMNTSARVSKIELRKNKALEKVCKFLSIVSSRVVIKLVKSGSTYIRRTAKTSS